MSVEHRATGVALMVAIKVFISYRRDTDGARATLVAKSIEGAVTAGGVLSREQGIELRTYLDVQDRLGVSWPERIKDELAASNIVVAIIGPEWLSAKDQYERRRIDQDDDWVRCELESALRGDGILVPILFDGAVMPPAAALPATIADLGDRQGLSVRTSNFDSDIQPLLREIVEQGRARLDKGYERTEGDYEDTRWPYPDPPLPVRPAQLSDQDVDLALKLMLPDWVRLESRLPEDDNKQRVELRRELLFGSFNDVLRFMNEVGQFVMQPTTIRAGRICTGRFASTSPHGILGIAFRNSTSLSPHIWTRCTEGM